MESKKEAKKRGIRSPDEADALCLSFALPSSALAMANAQNNITKKLASNLKTQLNAISKAARAHNAGF